MSDCEQLREYYEAYALGALEGEERAQLEAHLARRCPVCTPAVERARWVVAQLAYLAPEAEPRPALRVELLSDVTRQAPGRTRIAPVWLWAGAAAALLVFSFLSLRQVRQLQAELGELSRTVEAERRRAADLENERRRYVDALAILAAPDARLVRLKGPADLPELRGYWSEGRGIVLTGRRLPSPPADKAYQLWIVPKKGSPIGAGVFRPGTAGEITHLALSASAIGEAAALAVTEEPAGGSPQPTSSPLWVGPLS
jgi:anti-sigma-K factor RskA